MNQEDAPSRQISHLLILNASSTRPSFRVSPDADAQFPFIFGQTRTLIHVLVLPELCLPTMLVDSTRNSSSNSLVSRGISPNMSRCSRCAVPSSKLTRQKLGIVPANPSTTSTSSAAGGRARDYLCTDCLRRERSAPVRLGYECPGWAYGRFGYRCPPLNFREEVPRIETLVSAGSMSLLTRSASTAAVAQAATYDIVFLGIDQKFGPRIHRRVMPGSTLTLSLEECCLGNSLAATHFDENGDVVMADTSTSSSCDAGLASTTKETCLRGIVNMDRRSAITDAAWIDGMSFLAAPTQKSSMDEDDDNDNTVSVPGFNRGGHLNFTGHELRTSNHRNQRNAPKLAAAALHGQIRVVSSRAIVRSRPDSKATTRRRCVRPAIYSTIDEADAILHQHRTSIAPFLSRSLGLPEGPARLICEYWCDRPSPLMDFRAGDLVLTTKMPGRGFMNDTISTVLVARRRTEDCR